MAEKRGAIKKYIILAVVNLVIFASFWLVFNELQTKATTEWLWTGSFHALTPMLRTLLLISSFLLALTTVDIYILWRKAKPSVIIKTVSEPTSGVESYERLKVLKNDEKLVISTIAQSEGKMLQKELRTITKLPSYKITRILDRLEGLGVISREKYGMTNIIHLKFELEEMPEL